MMIFKQSNRIINSKFFYRAVLENVLFSIITGYVFYRSLTMMLILFIIFFSKTSKKITFLENKEINDNTMAFVDFLMVIKRLIASGMALTNAIEYSKQELKILYPDDNAWIVTRVCKISHSLKMQQDIIELFILWGQEDDIKEIENFGYLLSSINEFGGNINTLIQNIMDMVSQKIETEQEIKSLAVSKILEQKILFGLGYVMIVFLNGSFPELFSVLYYTLIGRIIMSITLFLMLIGKNIGIKIADIKV